MPIPEFSQDEKDEAIEAYQVVMEEGSTESIRNLVSLPAAFYMFDFAAFIPQLFVAAAIRELTEVLRND